MKFKIEQKRKNEENEKKKILTITDRKMCVGVTQLMSLSFVPKMTHFEESIWLTYRQDSHLTVTVIQFYRLTDLQDESNWLI